MVSVLFLFCVALWFILRGASRFLKSSRAVCPRVSSLAFSTVITSLGEKGAGLCASRAFALYVLRLIEPLNYFETYY